MRFAVGCFHIVHLFERVSRETPVFRRMLSLEEEARCCRWLQHLGFFLPSRNAIPFCCDPNHKLFSVPAGTLETTCLGNGPRCAAGPVLSPEGLRALTRTE